jgi:hypothetical protein
MGDLDAYGFDWRDYVRYGCSRNNYCDSGRLVGSCVAREAGFLERSHPASNPASSCTHEIGREWPKLHSRDGDSSATLQAMTAQTIPEYLEEERQKAADTQLRTEEESARIQLLQHGHHRKAKQPRVPLLPQVTAATKKNKKKKTVAVARKKPGAARKMPAKTRKRA